MYMMYTMSIWLFVAVVTCLVTVVTPLDSAAVSRLRRQTGNGDLLRSNDLSVPVSKHRAGHLLDNGNRVFSIRDTAKHGKHRMWFARKGLNVRFNLPTALKRGLPVRKAMLRLNKLPSSQTTPLDTPTMLEIHVQLRVRYGGSNSTLMGVHTQRVRSDYVGVIELNIGSAVRYWQRSKTTASSRTNRGLVVSVTNFRGEPVRGAIFQLRATDGKSALSLEIRAGGAEGGVSRRDAQQGGVATSADDVGAPECDGTDQKCCRHRMRISFAEIGWHWVVAPSHVDIGICSGACPNDMHAGNWHAALKSKLFRRTGRGKQAECAPKTYKPITILHYNDEDQLVTTDFQEMSVVSCACE